MDSYVVKAALKHIKHAENLPFHEKGTSNSLEIAERKKLFLYEKFNFNMK